MVNKISEINSITVNQLAINTSLEITKNISAITLRKLKNLDINVENIDSEEEALTAIDKKEQEKKIQSEQNSQTYFDKQIISDAIQLAQDLGISVFENDELSTIMQNIQLRLISLKEKLGDNKNLKEIVDEYSNRYDYIYSQYMDKGNTLKTQIIKSLDVMGTNGTVSANL